MDWEQCRKLVLQAIALAGMHALAIIYDAEFIPLALGVDAVVLGVTFNGTRAVAKDLVEERTNSG